MTLAVSISHFFSHLLSLLLHSLPLLLFDPWLHPVAFPWFPLQCRWKVAGSEWPCWKSALAITHPLDTDGRTRLLTAGGYMIRSPARPWHICASLIDLCFHRYKLVRFPNPLFALPIQTSQVPQPVFGSPIQTSQVPQPTFGFTNTI